MSLKLLTKSGHESNNREGSNFIQGIKIALNKMRSFMSRLQEHKSTLIHAFFYCSRDNNRIVSLAFNARDKNDLCHQYNRPLQRFSCNLFIGQFLFPIIYRDTSSVNISDSQFRSKTIEHYRAKHLFWPFFILAFR